MNKRPLEFKEYRNYNGDLLKLRNKMIEKVLGLKNINCDYRYDTDKKQFTYLYSQNNEIIFLEKEKLLEILKNINLLDNGDTFFSDSDELEKFNRYHNRDGKFNLRDVGGLKVHRGKELKIKEHLDDYHHSKNPTRIIKFLDVSPKAFHFFPWQDIYHKENMQRIDKYKLPLYKVMKENKFALLNILRNHCLNYTPEDINHFLLHDRIPFINYEELKENLTKYYGEEKKKYYKIFKKDEEDALLYPLGRDSIVITREPMGFNVYSHEPYIGPVEEAQMRNKYFDKFNSLVKNNDQIPLDAMTNKEILNLEIIDDEAHQNPEVPNSLNQQDNYHWGYFDNGIYKSHQGHEKVKPLKIKSDLIEIEILPEDENFHSIVIDVCKEKLYIDYFYIPEDKEFIIKTLLEKMWERGYFLTHFGKAVYQNEGKILTHQLVLPEWLSCYDKEEFNRLVKKINTLN